MAAMARCLALLLAAALLMSMADAQAAEWLAAHNSARAAVGVAPLVWNTTVYNAALAYANSQRTRCLPLTHSGNPEYGENLAYSSYPSTTPTIIVRDGWVGSEKPYYNYATNTCSAPAGRSCSHYTQVVWADTTSVGCAKVTCTNGIFYFVCNYYPPGNYIGEKPY